MRAAILRFGSRLVTSQRLQNTRRRLAALTRTLRGAKPMISFFHQPDDPYSRLALSALEPLRARYAVEVAVHRVSPPSDAAAPERAKLVAWSNRDAADLGKRLGLPPDGLDYDGPYAEGDGDALRDKLGHYLSGTFHFEGEWYWGLDRLHFLETRLREAGLAKPDAPPELIAPPADMRLDRTPRNGARPVLKWYFSFRSPYTYLAAARIRQLAEHYGAELRLKFILPMVMRGLPVPPAKRMYIVKDCAREARRLGIPFGTIVDPVGKGTERAIAVLHHAIGAGKGMAFAESTLTGSWAEGIDLTTDEGLNGVAARAGLDPAFVANALKDETWREPAETHRQDLFALGLWGAPTVQVDGRPAHWGQDRLWAVENDLAEATGATP
jgi:2-hydroxychromene-2-carboxylate isomerase